MLPMSHSPLWNIGGFEMINGTLTGYLGSTKGTVLYFPAADNEGAALRTRGRTWMGISET